MSRKFKHKKTGLVVSNINSNPNYYGIIGEFHIHHDIHIDFIKDSDDWEEITEGKNIYEIESIYGLKESAKKIDDIIKDYKIICYSQESNRLSHSLTKRDGTWDIHEIERLSDGTRFCLEDKVHDYRNKYESLTIYKFEVIIYTATQDTMGCYFKEIGYCINIDYLSHSKEPLFISKDGKEIFDGDTVYILNTNFKTGKICKSPDKKYYSKDIAFKDSGGTRYELVRHKSFSTKQAVEDYIIMNKSCLTLQEVNVERFRNRYNPINTTDDLKKLIREKLNL